MAESLQTSLPMLARRNSHLLPAKGNTTWGREALAKELKDGGYRRQVIRSDGEPAILAHIQASVHLAMLQNEATELVREVSTKGDSAGNGLAEGAVKEVKGKIRTLRHAAEEALGRKIPDTAPALSWLVTFAAMSINLDRAGVDGRTPYELRYGRSFKRALVLWGQKVQCMRPGRLVSRAPSDSRWEEGVFLGIRIGDARHGTYIVGIPAGVTEARAVKPVIPSEQWDVELLLAIRAVP